MKYKIQMQGYRTVTFNDLKYCVCRYLTKSGASKLFVVDAEDIDKVLDKESSWTIISGHIGYTILANKMNYKCYLHDIIIDKPVSMNKKQKFVVRHINGNSHDLRKCNLVVDTKSSIQRKTRKRNIDLPKNCGIKPQDIPKCVYYCPPTNDAGEMFIIDILCEDKKKIWKSSDSKKVTLKDKLAEINAVLAEISKINPGLIGGIPESDSDAGLVVDFNAIIELSKYKCAKKNLMKIIEVIADEKIKISDVMNLGELKKPIIGSKTSGMNKPIRSDAKETSSGFANSAIFEL